MGWSVSYSTRSRRDVQRIVEYIASDDPVAGERFGLALLHQAQALALTPFMGQALSGKPGGRFLPFGAYLILYRVDVKRQTVLIVRFWHGSRRRLPKR